MAHNNTPSRHLGPIPRHCPVRRRTSTFVILRNHVRPACTTLPLYSVETMDFTSRVPAISHQTDQLRPPVRVLGTTAPYEDHDATRCCSLESASNSCPSLPVESILVHSTSRARGQNIVAAHNRLPARSWRQTAGHLTSHTHAHTHAFSRTGASQFMILSGFTQN